MAERPAPLVLVTLPRQGQAFGSHAAVAADGQRLLATELSRRLATLGAAVVPLPWAPPSGDGFHWGRWFADAARKALTDAPGTVDAIGYAAGASMALADDRSLEALLSPIPGEVVANNRFSSDAFVVAGDLTRALEALEGCPNDNAAPRRLDDAGFAWRDLADEPWVRFDVDTTLDLALLRLSTRLAGVRRSDGAVASFLEMARIPGDHRLSVPRLDEIGEVIRSRSAELVVAGRVPASVVAYLETETACRVRLFVEERGMRSSPGGGQRPRSVLATLMERTSTSEVVQALSRLGDAVVIDTRVLMASVVGSPAAEAWPAEEERFASDFLDAGRVETPWLRELTDAAASSSVPFLFGGHALVSDGLRIIVMAAWQGRPDSRR